MCKLAHEQSLTLLMVAHCSRCDAAFNVATRKLRTQVQARQLAVVWLVLFKPIDRKHRQHTASFVQNGG